MRQADIDGRDKVFEQKSTSCTPTERVYRSYSSGAVLSSDLTKAAGKHCAFPSQCKLSKTGSSLQAATCTELLRIRDEITSGGYTATCRHDQTNWNVSPPEKKGCGADGVCTDPNYSIFLQRRLSPAGLRRSSVQGQSLLKAGVQIDSLVSSSYERSKNSAKQVGYWFGITEVKEEPLPLDNGVHGAQDYERKAGYEPKTDSDRGSDIKKIMRVRMRNWLQEDWDKQTEGGVRFTYSHGGTMENAFGHSFDEGDCAWSKPTDKTYDLNEPLTVVLSQKEFPNEMEVGTKKIDLFAVLSPEQTQKMAQCTELRKDYEDSISSSDTTILAADKDKDLEITEDEFTKFCENSVDTSRTCSDLWKSILSLQAKPYWQKNTVSTSFFIGEHAYFNGGWYEKEHSYGAWQFPYRGTTLDTIRPTVSEMKQILAPLDELIRADLNDKETKAVVDCIPQESTIQQFSSCASSLLSYKPIPTRNRPEDDVHLTDDYPILGQKYAYPTTITITPVPNPVMKLAMCLVEKRHITAERMSQLMGCELAGSANQKGASCTPSENGYRLNSGYRHQFVFVVVLTIIYNMF
ncbi:uncharacterized protein LOC134818162 [Bolinopsis microptera]|uniref:uncharacterized protein LOC134818162 n=1 Tax=Bolinopsis microptera TaxID=2820187 RepID=UPI003079BD3A